MHEPTQWRGRAQDEVRLEAAFIGEEGGQLRAGPCSLSQGATTLVGRHAQAYTGEAGTHLGYRGVWNVSEFDAWSYLQDQWAILEGQQQIHGKAV